MSGQQAISFCSKMGLLGEVVIEIMQFVSGYLDF